jgi:hypothetical protein
MIESRLNESEVRRESEPAPIFTYSDKSPRMVQKTPGLDNHSQVRAWS